MQSQTATINQIYQKVQDIESQLKQVKIELSEAEDATLTDEEIAILDETEKEDARGEFVRMS